MKTWLITGCSSGFGRNLAKTLLEGGEQVVVTARKPETLSDFSEQYPQTALVHRLDVTDNESIKETAASAIERFGKIDVLVNNAGYCLRGAVEECTEKEIYDQFNTNFFGSVRMIQAVLPFMRKAHSGCIINYSSIAALQTSPGSAFYGATKAALESLSDGLRKEVGPLGIKVMVVEPGPFKTDFFNRSIGIGMNGIDDYADTAGRRKVRTPDLTELDMKWCDMRKSCELIIDLAGRSNTPHHILLGSMAVKIGEQYAVDRLKEVGRWESESMSLDA